MRVTVIGLGYIGLPTAISFANAGVDVRGVDINSSVVELLNSGQPHINEPSVEENLRMAIESGCLKIGKNIVASDTFVIAVPTPLSDGDKKPNLEHVFHACSQIAKVLKKGDTIILESTCPVNSTGEVTKYLANLCPSLNFPLGESDEADIYVAYCPERVLPGNIFYELVYNDKIIGGVTSACADKAAIVYSYYVKGNIHKTSAKIAELAKLVENSFRDINIAFANELSLLCDKISIDVMELISLVNYHPRVNVLKPGPGVGGHCIAVDPWFLIDGFKGEVPLIEMARRVNDSKPSWVVSKILSEAGKLGGASEVNIAMLGLTYKPDISDFRESPSIQIMQELKSSYDGLVQVFDPYFKDNEIDVKSNKLEEALSKFELVVLLVEHEEFKQINWQSCRAKVLRFC